MIRLEYKINGAWRLLGKAKDSQQHEAHTVLQALANLTGNTTRVSRDRACNPPDVLGYCEPENRL